LLRENFALHLQNDYLEKICFLIFSLSKDHSSKSRVAIISFQHKPLNRTMSDNHTNHHQREIGSKPRSTAIGWNKIRAALKEIELMRNNE
jgi:hypothetical protein